MTSTRITDVPEQLRSGRSHTHLLEGTARRVASVAVAAILLIAFANVLDIILRNGFGRSLYGLNEINAYLVAIAAATCLPYGLHVGAALVITVLERKVSHTASKLMALFAASLTMLFFGLVAWRVFEVAQTMQRTGQTTIMTNVATAPFVYGMTIALVLAALVMAVQIVRNAREALAIGGLPGLAGTVLLGLILSWVALSMMGILPGRPFTVLAPQNPLILALLVFIGMWVLILLTVPIGVAMGIAGLIGTATMLDSGASLDVLGSEITSFVLQDGMSVLPLFLLMGAFASVAGIGSDLYRLANAMVGHIRGGLAHASILACAAFGTLTGSSIATQMSIGRIALGEMRARNYSAELSSGSIAAGGTLGQLIPPSSALILYAIMTQESVGKLFVGAILPGILATILYMGAVVIWLILFPKHAEAGPRAPLGELADAAKKSWSVLLLLAVVLGGIYFGFFTELEAGSVGAAGAFVIAVARGKINVESFWQTMAETTRTLAMMYSLIFGVTMLSFFFGISDVPGAFVSLVNTLGLPPLGVIIALIACYLVLGTAMDAFAMMVITIPIFVPLVENLGYDPIWWGLMTIICVEAGMISPPFGINIFVISALDRSIPLATVYRGCWPFFGSTILKIILLILFPAIVTFLPSTM
ncbi:TRAP transporter large permease subunit [Martelella sp. HB161492]|uniref:TRAP transporter large permease n=1 Tax=Martelella sp. HB161492 TaxID=2720726 RepID=UPI0015925EDA|nr:TRAP transporter large permease subunit [Martelella sp. HB161492]